MTRLHIQVNQTMQFYRGQQGGSAPQRLFLSGGASVMPYTAQFFAEKLNVPVEYFNPLRNVQIDPSINLEDLARVAHSLGEVVGLGLRNLAHCPIELNLMPASTLKWQSFNQKKPYFIATIFGLVALIAALGFLFGQLASVQNAELEKTQLQLEPMRRKADQFKRAYASLQRTEKELGDYSGWVGERFFWVDVLGEVRQALMRSEAGMKAQFRTDTGIWIEQLSSFAMAPSAGVEVASTESSGTQVVGALDAEARRRFMQRYGLRTMGGPAATPDAQPQADTTATDPAARKSASNTNEVSTLTFTFRAVSLSAAGAGANQELVFSVIDEIRKSPLFDEKETTSSGNIGNEEPPGTFNFGVNVKLKRPIKL
jgi:hypothetical protein